MLTDRACAHRQAATAKERAVLALGTAMAGRLSALSWEDPTYHQRGA